MTAGIVSARNRDINSGPYDNYIQTDAAINRGNSGGPLFNLEGEVIGVNTAIISPSGGSIGIGFAVPSKTALTVIDQLKQFGETRRGWLGVRIQLVTDEIAESLGIKPPRGALVAGVDDKGPAKPAGIQPGDVIIKFDGKDIREMRDLPRVVADAPVGKEVPVVDHPQGQGRDPDGDARPARGRRAAGGAHQARHRAGSAGAVGTKGARHRPCRRSRTSCARSTRSATRVKGVVILGVDANSPAADKRLSPGDVIVEIAQEAVASAGRLPGQGRQAQEGRPQDGAAAGRGCRRRTAVRGAELAVNPRSLSVVMVGHSPSKTGVNALVCPATHVCKPRLRACGNA